MKKTNQLPTAFLAGLLLALPPLSAPALAEEELAVTEIVETVDLDQPAATDGWSFPVALEDMNPEYIVLANKHYLLSEDYVPRDLVKVPKDPKKGGIKWKSAPKEGHQLRKDCAEALCAMNAAMREIDGFQEMYLKSAYRSYRTQKTMYRNRLAKHNGKDDGWVSQPGASDHQTGLGCDVIPYNWTKKSGMNEKMMQEEECQWMAAHCHEYGFIIRYPAEKKDWTEINTEPWHLRYVGIPVATYIAENGLCLEEFHQQLQAAIDGYLAAGGDRSRVEAFIQVSSDEN